MKKDYIPIDELQYLLDDASFSGKYWSKVWKEKGKIFLGGFYGKNTGS
jgi:hypothetical protein